MFLNIFVIPILITTPQCQLSMINRTPSQERQCLGIVDRKYLVSKNTHLEGHTGTPDRCGHKTEFQDVPRKVSVALTSIPGENLDLKRGLCLSLQPGRGGARSRPPFLLAWRVLESPAHDLKHSLGKRSGKLASVKILFVLT